jgi:glycosyltransferase involved in cell wall biosynthesis
VNRVCFVIPSLGAGGTERQLTYLIRGLVSDHEVTVICTREPGALAGDVRRMGAFVRVLDGWGGWDIRLRGRVRKVFRAHRPDIVHTFMFGFDYAVNRAARQTGVPVVLSSRRQLATWMKPRHIRHQKKANKLVDGVVANSRAVADFAVKQEGLREDLVQVIHNGFSPEDFVSTADPKQIRLRYRLSFHTHVVGIVANFSPVKDHALFLAVAEQLMSRRDDCHFLMVGTGPHRKEIQRVIRSRDWTDRFTRVATLGELGDLYRIMAVSVLCSKVEGFPNVVMESMAMGVPVVAPAVGGIPELVEDGVTGKLVGSRSPADFADAIDWVLDHPEESQAMGSRAAKQVRTTLSTEAMVNAYRALYNRLLANACRAGV